MSQQSCIAKNKGNGVCICIRSTGVFPGGWWRYSFPFFQPWWGHFWKAVSSFRLSNTRESSMHWSLAKGHKDVQGSGPFFQWGKTERWACAAWRSLINVYKYLKGMVHKGWSQALASLPITGSEVMDTHWNTGSSLWTWKIHIFTVRVYPSPIQKATWTWSWATKF